LTSTWTCIQCLPGRFTQSDGPDRGLSAGCQEGRMTPHGRAHCNDLKVRAPSSRAANPTMMVRGWPATSGEVTTTPVAWARHFDGIEEISHPGGGNSLVAPRRYLHRLLRWSRSPRGGPSWRTGHRRRIRQVPAHWMPSRRGAPRGARVFRSSLCIRRSGWP